MKNDIWKLLLIKKNEAASVTGRPAADLITIDNAIDLIEQVMNGFSELMHSPNYNLVQLRSEMASCARISCDLVKSRVHLIEILNRANGEVQK